MTNRVTEALRLLKLDHAALGELMGVHRTTVSRWEKGEVAISGPAARLLDDLLADKRKKTRAGATA